LPIPKKVKVAEANPVRPPNIAKKMAVLRLNSGEYRIRCIGNRILIFDTILALPETQGALISR
jgi:hypothetical protein